MDETPAENASPSASQQTEIQDRTCTWCRVTMHNRVVGAGRYIHYVCPRCLFQHTVKHPSAQEQT